MTLAEKSRNIYLYEGMDATVLELKAVVNCNLAASCPLIFMARTSLFHSCSRAAPTALESSAMLLIVNRTVLGETKRVYETASQHFRVAQSSRESCNNKKL